MVANGLAPKTVERAYTFVAAIMKAAVHDRVLPSSPCVGISLPRVGNPEVTIPTVETVEALAAAVGDHYRPFVVFLAGSGLRVSEAFALRTSDIDWLRRTVKVSKQAGRHGEDVPPKSSASVRTVPLAQCVIDELAASIAAREVETDHLFVDPDGRPLDHHSWGEVWRKAREVVGTTVRTHDLRHLYASALINGGCSVKSVQTVLGHASAAITLRTYAHVWPGDEDRTRNVIEKALRGLSRTPRGLDDHSADNTAGQTAVALVK
jgi:integrase